MVAYIFLVRMMLLITAGIVILKLILMIVGDDHDDYSIIKKMWRYIYSRFSTKQKVLYQWKYTEKQPETWEEKQELINIYYSHKFKKPAQLQELTTEFNKEIISMYYGENKNHIESVELINYVKNKRTEELYYFTDISENIAFGKINLSTISSLVTKEGSHSEIIALDYFPVFNYIQTLIGKNLDSTIKEKIDKIVLSYLQALENGIDSIKELELSIEEKTKQRLNEDLEEELNYIKERGYYND